MGVVILEGGDSVYYMGHADGYASALLEAFHERRRSMMWHSTRFVPRAEIIKLEERA